MTRLNLTVLSLVMLSTDNLIRTACQTMAIHGEDAAVYARSRADAFRNDPAAAAVWDHVSNLIGMIYDKGFYPGD